MGQRAALGVQAQVRVTLVNLFVAVAADLTPDICRHIGIRQLGNERMTQRMEAERFELATFARLLTIRVNASRSRATFGLICSDYDQVDSF